MIRENHSEPILIFFLLRYELQASLHERPMNDRPFGMFWADVTDIPILIDLEMFRQNHTSRNLIPFELQR
jgi:hypothetical protein